MNEGASNEEGNSRDQKNGLSNDGLFGGQSTEGDNTPGATEDLLGQILRSV